MSSITTVSPQATQEWVFATAGSETFQLNTNSIHGYAYHQLNTEEEKKRYIIEYGTKLPQVVQTSTYFLYDRQARIMYYIDIHSPAGHTLTKHRREWTREERMRYFRQNAHSSQPWIGE